jgi:hypothetical protein
MRAETEEHLEKRREEKRRECIRTKLLQMQRRGC